MNVIHISYTEKIHSEMAASEESPTFFIDELLKGSKIEVGNLFNKLSSWSKEREESQKQLSNIICSYNTIVTPIRAINTE